MKLVLVVDPACDACIAAARDLASIRREMKIPPVVISTSTAAQTAAFGQRYGLDGILFRVTDSTSRTIRRKLSGNPQIMLVNDHSVVRTCPTVRECFEAASKPETHAVFTPPVSRPASE